MRTVQSACDRRAAASMGRDGDALELTARTAAEIRMLEHHAKARSPLTLLA